MVLSFNWQDTGLLIREMWVRIPRESPYTPVSQRAEEAVLKTAKCWFESSQEYHITGGYSSG